MSDGKAKMNRISPCTVSSQTVEVLKGENWLAWKHRMTRLLRLYKVLEYVEGQVPKPDPENKIETETWRQNDLHAQFLILNNISDGEMIHVYACDTAADMWKGLKAAHEVTERRAVFAGVRALHRGRAEPGPNMVIPKHLNEMKKLRYKLAEMGHRVSDENFQSILVASLPDSWDSFTQSYLGTIGGTQEGATQCTSQELICAITNEWNRRNHPGLILCNRSCTW